MADEGLRSFAFSPGIMRSHRREPPPASTLPAPPAPRPGRAAIASMQVGVKLAPDDHRRLRRAAALYGLPPATLARLLVNRAVRAILVAEGEAKAELGPR